MSEIVNGAEINETHANVKRSRSKFMLKQRVMDTMRFGEYHPHFVFDGVTSDKLVFRSIHNARSYTLKAPLMQNVNLHKDYFYIPLRAILPNQADRIITNPTLGDDVPSDAYTSVSDFLSKIRSIHTAFFNYIKALDSSDNAKVLESLELCLKHFVFLESVFSNGSLLSSLGCNLNSCLRLRVSGMSPLPSSLVFIDSFFDSLVDFYQTYVASSNGLDVTIDGVSYFVKDVSDFIPQTYQTISWNEFLMRIRDTSDWSLDSFNTANVSDCKKVITVLYLNSLNWEFSSNSFPLDLARLWAYHICQAEFYTNDKVDYIYSAELFRQYIWNLMRGVSDLNASSSFFLYNGAYLPYDYLSSHYFDLFVTDFTTLLSGGSFSIRLFQYFLTLFGYHRSLRFKDYFTGSRTRPLAVGDVNAPVVSNQVSVIDVSRKIQVQRYLNAVNATGRKFEEYLKGIFGVAPSPDHHNPLLLSHTSDSIFTSEVENTGSAQWDINSDTSKNSVTAIFRGSSNKFAFEFEVKEPCIILGITSFDIERCYPLLMDRSFLTKDRFDMFLPQLQYVGDQPVYRCELNPFLSNPLNPWAYQFRDMERKQLINRCCGGFSAGSLPGYAFIFPRNFTSFSQSLSPDFIRSICSELDQFYLSLSGHSLGTYFHFIVSNDNICEASRPMAVNPQILG